VQNFNERIKQQLDEVEIISLVSELIAIPSYRGIEKQETRVAEYLDRFFKREGISSEVIPIKDGRCNVVARLPGSGGGRTFLLNSHLDTVPPYDMAGPCVPRVEGGRIYGRGAVDTKGVLACMAVAVAALSRAGIILKGDLIFTGVIDEEDGSAGSIDLVKKGLQADGAIVGEPTGFDLCLGQRGLEWLEFRFQGATVHGGNRAGAPNAIRMAAFFIAKCERELIPVLQERSHPLLGSASMNYGFIRGGSQPSTVAGECILQVDRRWLPDEDHSAVLGEYAELLRALSREEPQFKGSMRLMEVGRMEEGYLHTGSLLDPSHPLVGAAAESVTEVLGAPPGQRAFTAWSDAGVLSTYGGIPSLILAPGDLAAAHSAGEHIEIKDLLPAALIYALTAARFCL
jgi:acetylornithine deacetylase/succinyl-diaminopimelate desuccinylase family protein